MVGTSGDSIKSAAPSLPASVNRFNTPGGTSLTDSKTSLIKAFTCAVCEGILITTVQPTANAGARERTIRTIGEFQGAIMPATPIGALSTILNEPGFVSNARPYSVSDNAA